MKMLIVDDDEINRRLLQVLAKPFGETQMAVNGLEALESYKKEAAAEQPFDVIFLDIMMPEMSGHDCLQQIRKLEGESGIESGEGTKIVMVTALGDARNVMNAFSAGAEYYLVKPVQQRKLYELMAEMGFHPGAEA